MHSMNHDSQIVNISFLSRPQVCQIIGCSKSTLIRWEAAGEFPASVTLGPRRIAYRVEDVRRWIESRPSNSVSA